MKRLNKRESKRTFIDYSYLPKEIAAELEKLLAQNSIERVLFSVLKKYNNAYSKLLISKLNLMFNSTIEVSDDVLYFDVIGFLIMSIKTEGDKNAEGVVFTPYEIVKNVISKFSNETGYLDPAAGSGAFLIELAKMGKKIEGYEIDEINYLAANCTLNFVLNTSNKKYVQHVDSLEIDWNSKLSVIGNPPWGIKNFLYIHKDFWNTTESFEAFIFKILESNRRAAFVLPNSILYRKKYKKIRKELYKYGVSIFDLPSIKNVNTDIILLMIDVDEKYYEYNERAISTDVMSDEINPNFIWYDYSDDDIKKLVGIRNSNSILLKDLIDETWMGIVTGNNKKYLSDKKTKKYSEKIISGKNIKDGNLVGNFQYFDPKSIHEFQQVNKKINFKQEKIVYRFIGEKVEFFHDKEGLFTLNTLNCFTLKDKTLYPSVIRALNDEDSKKYIQLIGGQGLQNLITDIERLPMQSKFIKDIFDKIREIANIENSEIIKKIREIEDDAQKGFVYLLAGKSYGSYVENQILNLSNQFKKPSKKYDDGYKPQAYDIWCVSNKMKFEVKAVRASKIIKNGKNEVLIDKAIRSTDNEDFWANFQQIKPKLADAFIFVLDWVDKREYFFIPSKEINNTLPGFQGHQHRGNTDEFQVWMNKSNYNKFDKYKLSEKQLVKKMEEYK